MFVCFLVGCVLVGGWWCFGFLSGVGWVADDEFLIWVGLVGWLDV